MSNHETRVSDVDAKWLRERMASLQVTNVAVAEALRLRGPDIVAKMRSGVRAIKGYEAEQLIEFFAAIEDALPQQEKQTGGTVGRLFFVPLFSAADRAQDATNPDSSQGSAIPFLLDRLLRQVGRRKINRLIALDVDNDSMSPTLPSGSMTLVDTSLTVPDGGISAYRWGEQIFIGRLRMTPEGISVSYDNPLLSGQGFTVPHDSKEFEAIGRVCWVSHGL